jgi:uncharacterized surface protein with fasciclin (FAS1) repeats
MPLHPLRCWLVVLVVAGGLLAGCGEGEDGAGAADGPREPLRVDTVQADDVTVARLLGSDARFSTLVAALDSAGLRAALDSAGTYTLFAPTNAAFDALPEGTVEALLNDEREQLRRVLRHHLLPRRVAIGGGGPARRRVPTALDGDTLSIATGRDTIRVGPARVLEADVRASNGVVHVIDRVLPPPSSTGGR